jgi:heterodisulfide reductase subunit C
MSHIASAARASAVAVDPLASLPVGDCYQCGKCTAGCPVADRMDPAPNQIVRLVQLGRVDAAVRSGSIWECVSCQTCTTRCPKSVDCAAVMDALRQMAFQSGVAPASALRTVLFQKAFLQNIRRNGRLNELELIAAFKTTAFLRDFSVGLLLKDAMLAPRMRARGKLHLVGEKVRDRRVVDRIFARCPVHEEPTTRLPHPGPGGTVPTREG